MLTREKIIGTIGYMGGVMAVPEPFCWAWGNLLAHSERNMCQPGEHILAERTKLSLHDYGRNELVAKMRGDWLLMLDTDLSFGPDLAARMVRLFELNNLDVLCGIYSYKTPPHYPVVYQYNPEAKRNEILAGWDRSVTLLQIDSAGAGTLLVRRRVFERIAKEMQQRPFDRIGNKGEDHSFFERLRTLGIESFCAPHIEADHMEFLGVRTSADYVPPETFDHEYVRQSR